MSSAKVHQDAEQTVRRNPHPDFKKVEASRQPFDHSIQWNIKQTMNTSWSFGDGASDKSKTAIPHVEIDPYAEGRPSAFNYKLLISAYVPRPIAFVSTRSADGTSTNLAPFSYTQMINHDPPMFIIGYSGGLAHPKDSLRNLKESGECVINMVSEHFLEAVNSTSIDAPYGISEWALSGLTPEKCAVVKASRVKESVFSIEAKLESLREFESKNTKGKMTGVLAIVEGVRFWVREDAINADRSLADPAVLKPISRLGGIMYGRATESIELVRPAWSDAIKKEEVKNLALPKARGQL